MKKLSILCISGIALFSIAISSLSAQDKFPELVGFAKEEIRPFIQSYQDGDLQYEFTFNPVNGTAKISQWEFSMEMNPVQGQPDATDYKLTWKLIKGEAQEIVAGVNFLFNDWSTKEFVFVPAIVYDGNRFEVKKMSYPPFWYDKNEWRIDMPTTTRGLPALNEDSKNKIEINTGNASTPLMAFHSPEKKRAWMVLTTQGSRFGNHGLYIEEAKELSEAKFSITAPDIREFTSAVDNAADSDNHIRKKWKTGDSVEILFRIYSFEAPAIKDMFKRFSEVRKELNPYQRKEVLPFSEATKLLNNLYLQDRWDDNIDMFCMSKPGTGTQWCFIWQLGWVGGGQATLPMLMQDSEELQQKALKNIDVIFSKTQAPSGFFYAYGNGYEFTGFGYFSALENNVTFVRSQGDWLYMAQRQFVEMESRDKKVPPQWKSSLQKQADAFVRLWDKYGQFGQFVDVQTGDICIGSSTAGAIVCGGLALASQTFHSPRYLEVAQAAAEKYYNDYVLKGYTTGGPGEILSAPDSESAFGLFESFVTLYEITEDKKWLQYASDLLPICASWTVSYDYLFPEKSVMGSMDARSCGSVWASVSNKHSAPGICTWSGDCLLKYFRASDDARAIELLADIAHGLPQYISRADRPVGNMPPGGICERVNLSDWEGKKSIGGNIFGSCSWCETAALLTVVQLPGIYLQPDKGICVTLDNIQVDVLESRNNTMRLKLSNPTPFPAEVKIFSESSEQAKQNLFCIDSENTQIVRLEPNEQKELVVP